MKKRNDNKRAYLYSGLSLLLIFVVVVFPILYTAYISLTNMNLYHWFDFDFIGLDHVHDIRKRGKRLFASGRSDDHDVFIEIRAFRFIALGKGNVAGANEENKNGNQEPSM